MNTALNRRLPESAAATKIFPGAWECARPGAQRLSTNSACPTFRQLSDVRRLLRPGTGALRLGRGWAALKYALLVLLALAKAVPAQKAPRAQARAAIDLPGQKLDGSVLLPNLWSLRPVGKQ